MLDQPFGLTKLQPWMHGRSASATDTLLHDGGSPHDSHLWRIFTFARRTAGGCQARPDSVTRCESRAFSIG